jgi:hypothetical protein
MFVERNTACECKAFTSSKTRDDEYLSDNITVSILGNTINTKENFTC